MKKYPDVCAGGEKVGRGGGFCPSLGQPHKEQLAFHSFSLFILLYNFLKEFVDFS